MFKKKNKNEETAVNEEIKERSNILFNRKNLVNANGFIFGVTGGGKSFTGAKLEIQKKLRISIRNLQKESNKECSRKRTKMKK